MVNQCPDQPLFGRFYLSDRRQLTLFDSRLFLDCRFSDLRSNYLFCNSRLVSEPVRELVPGGRVGDPGSHGEHSAEELAPAVVLREVMLRRSPFEQILEVLPGMTQLLLVRRTAELPDEIIGIVARRQHG